MLINICYGKEKYEVNKYWELLCKSKTREHFDLTLTL